MNRKCFILSLLIIFSYVSLCAQRKELNDVNKQYKQFVDTTLLQIKSAILNDLKSKEITVANCQEKYLGVSFELRIVFENNHYFVMDSRRSMSQFPKKSMKFKNIYTKALGGKLRTFIREKNTFPPWINYIEYHFIDEVKGSNSGLYAKYKLKDSSGGLVIISTTLEQLKDADAILKKNYADW